MERMDVSLKVRSTNYVLGLKLGVIVKNINEETSRMNIGPLDPNPSEVGNMDFFFEPAKNGGLPVAVIGMHRECAGEPIWFTIESEIPCEFVIALANAEGAYDTVVGEMTGPVTEMTFSLNDLLYPGQPAPNVVSSVVDMDADVSDVSDSALSADSSIEGQGNSFPGMSSTPIQTMVDMTSQPDSASNDVDPDKQAS